MKKKLVPTYTIYFGITSMKGKKGDEISKI